MLFPFPETERGKEAERKEENGVERRGREHAIEVRGETGDGGCETRLLQRRDERAKRDAGQLGGRFDTEG